MDENDPTIEAGRTVTHYLYNENGELVKQTQIRYEPKPQPDGEFDGVKGFVDVLNSQVQEYLDQDYVIYKVYQKNSILMKKEEKKDEV